MRRVARAVESCQWNTSGVADVWNLGSKKRCSNESTPEEGGTFEVRESCRRAISAKPPARERRMRGRIPGVSSPKICGGSRRASIVAGFEQEDHFGHQFLIDGDGKRAVAGGAGRRRDFSMYCSQVSTF